MPSVIEQLTALSTEPAVPERIAAREPLVKRANTVVAEFHRLRRQFADLADELAQINTKTLATKIIPVMFPLVASLASNGRHLRDLLDADLLDLRQARRETRTALSGPVSEFVSSMQAFEKFIKLGEGHVQAVGAVVIGIERGLARLTSMEFVSTSTVIPTPLGGTR